ncbi:MAG: alpha/beta fold hydrolase [Actinomycetota bacterium]|nr:alpha/beta fold hydrolase [Actinomycetota bacterium]
MREKIFFFNSKGYRLAGVLNLPSANPPFPIVVFSHGFDSGKDSPRSIPISNELVNHGIATFLIDFTGHGESEGTKEESTIFQQLDDLRHAVFLAKGRKEIDNRRIALHGSSSGCLVCLYYSLLYHSLEAYIVTMVLRAPRTDGYFPDLYERASEIKTPTLFIQGSEDPLLPYTKMFSRAMTALVSLKVIEGANHLFTNPVHYRIVLELTVNWFKEKLIEEFGAAAA